MTMRSLFSVLAIIALSILGGSAQGEGGEVSASGVADTFRDNPSGIEFRRFFQAKHGISIGFVFPPTSTSSDEFIGLFVMPVTSNDDPGWIGVSLGGRMVDSLLVVGWLNGNQGVVSTRYAEGYSPPAMYSGPKITILSTTGKNETHQRILYRCQNCTSWVGGKKIADPKMNIGWAVGDLPGSASSNPESDILVHAEAGLGELSISRSSSYTQSLSQLSSSSQSSPPSSNGGSTNPASTSTSSSPTSRSSSLPALPEGGGICTEGGNPKSRYPLRVAKGWRAGAVLSGLSTPRGITMDKQGRLLVVESRKGITIHALGPDGCVTNSRILVNQTDLNHGIQMSPDGKVLYASSMETVFRWDYDANAGEVSNRQAIINGMRFSSGDHPTRTLLIPSKNPGILVVSRGSTGNLDWDSFRAETGRAIVKVFDLGDLSGESPTNYVSGGKVLGYGLRNDVGVTEDKAGNIWTVENSADNIVRQTGAQTSDVHNDNPAEPFWNLGDPAKPSGFFGGYPYCFMIWGNDLFGGENVRPGNWFVQQPNDTVNDEWCKSVSGKKPALMLPPHSAPLDIKFGLGADTAAYVSLHGSWNRDTPQGYKVVRVPGKYASDGSWAPAASISSTEGFTDFLSNVDEAKCGSGCFRPVGLQWDKGGNNLYVGSDASGEIFLLRREVPVDPSGGSQTPSTTGTGSGASKPKQAICHLRKPMGLDTPQRVLQKKKAKRRFKLF